MQLWEIERRRPMRKTVGVQQRSAQCAIIASMSEIACFRQLPGCGLAVFAFAGAQFRAAAEPAGSHLRFGSRISRL